jgi:ribosomal protein L21
LKIVEKQRNYFFYFQGLIKIKCIFATKSINQFGMYAIVEIGATIQNKDLKVYVHRLTNEEGTTVSFDKVYLLDDNGVITIGAPIEGASVEAKVLQQKEIKLSFSKEKKGYKEMVTDSFLLKL